MLDVLLREEIHNVAVVVTLAGGAFGTRRPGAGVSGSRAGGACVGAHYR